MTLRRNCFYGGLKRGKNKSCMSKADLTVIFEQDKEGNIIATAPDLPNCRVVCKSMAEAQKKIKDAIIKEIGCVPGSTVHLESITPSGQSGCAHGSDCKCQN